ncbi:metal ABC transporter ATP-binding protein [Nocardioides sp. B-3]|uniref:metal ABC transporter ATP-binding protein n=1 Tax=Nocardioides sp. B-3 TaxID=2895565 RepID=UPI0021538361|nr:ATP-binding cassette domain-containing protein [Nocardioides sp. B-3]UUZ58544.1 ATP-binding cassette domain-containing protein [Nocardioides sp. B-3]
MLNALGAPVVEARAVTVAIGGRPVLRGNDLTVREGEFVALMGANGSGKSTLVRALTGLRPLTLGSVHLFGTPLEDFRDRRRIGFVPQRATAAGGVPASVREVVASGRLTGRRLLRLPTRADRIAIDDAPEVVGLSHRAHDGVSTLSGGQQQRVLIARPGRGAGALLPRRAHRWSGPAEPAGPRGSPAHTLGARRHRGARRPRARPAGTPGRPGSRDARRTHRL